MNRPQRALSLSYPGPLQNNFWRLGEGKLRLRRAPDEWQGLICTPMALSYEDWPEALLYPKEKIQIISRGPTLPNGTCDKPIFYVAVLRSPCLLTLGRHLHYTVLCAC